MLHKMRREPQSYYEYKRESKRLAWRCKVTLCMAAICRDKDEGRIVICGDAWIETGWAGSNIGFKVSIAGPQLPALYAGDVSQAEGLLATSRAVFNTNPLNRNTVFDILNDVVSIHKSKLCDRYIQGRIGIPYERFLTQGEKELDETTRNELLAELRELEFGCDLIIVGFVDHEFIFHIGRHGRVSRMHDFVAIGSGELIADAVLFQREQSHTNSVERTLYNLYEASTLARIAPGVGETKSFCVVAPPISNPGSLRLKILQGESLDVLRQTFGEVGPKKLTNDPVINKDSYSSITNQPKPDDAHEPLPKRSEP